MSRADQGGRLLALAVDLMRGKELGTVPQDASRVARLLGATRSSKPALALTQWTSHALTQAARTSRAIASQPVPRFLQDVALSIKRSAQKAGAAARRVNRAGLLDRVERLALDDARVLYFGLERAQTRVLQALLSQPFGRVKVGAAIDAVRAAEQSAAELSATLATYWQRAAPEGQTAAQAVKKVYDDLVRAMAGKKPPNPTDFVREALFNPWRERFFQQFMEGGSVRPECEAFLERLQRSTGLQLLPGATSQASPRFGVALSVGEVRKWLEMDIDHAEQDLAVAVAQALKQGDARLLRPVVEASSLQLSSARQNRYLFHAFRRQARKEVEQATRGGGRASAQDRRDLQAYLAEVLDLIDEAPDFRPP